MTFSTLGLRSWLGTAFAPGELYRSWQRRVVLRRDLARLVADPYLLDDVGFSRDTAIAETLRAPWEPVANLRRSRRG